MKKMGKYLLTLLMLFAFSASFVSAAGPVSLEKAAGILRDGKNCYIIGGFKLIHTLDPSVGDPAEVNAAQDLNGQCVFHARINVLNTDNNKSYSFDVNPVTGSNTIRYYRNSKKLEWNDSNPYWFIEVPPGTYEVTNFTVDVTITMNGYLPFSEKWIDAPVSRVINRTVNFSVQDKQIVYIGDYECSLKSFICLNKITRLYWPCRLVIDLNDNFDSVNEALLNTAKGQKTALEIVSGL